LKNNANFTFYFFYSRTVSHYLMVLIRTEGFLVNQLINGGKYLIYSRFGNQILTKYISNWSGHKTNHGIRNKALAQKLQWFFSLCKPRYISCWGEILKSPENSVPQTIVFRYKEIGDKLCGKRRKKVMGMSKHSLDRNNTVASLFRTQYTPDFLIAEYYGLRNTILWGGLRISPLEM
jgi:hypothetical protein